MTTTSLLHKKHLLTLAGVAVLALLIAWQFGLFTFGRVRPGQTPPPAAPPAGTPIVLALTNMTEQYHAVGTISSRTMVDLAPRIVARVLGMTVRAGDRVTNGQVLVTLDYADLLAATGQAGERLRAARAAVRGAAEKVQQVQAAYDLSRVEVERVRTLTASGALSRQALDNAESAYRQARAALAQAGQGASAAQAEAQAVEQAQAQSQAALGYATIASPMNGIVAERRAEPGDLASPGVVLLRLFDPARLMLEVPVREALITRIKLGDQVPFRVAALGKTYHGTVREIVPAVDPGSRTFLVRICIGAVPELVPGMFGTLALPLGTRPALRLPERAITRVGQLEYVLAQIGGSPQRVLVRTLPAADGLCEVVSGLAPGMTVYCP
jgi:RND family efflux transporter MFP subunit